MFLENSKTTLCDPNNVKIMESLHFSDHEEADTRIFAILSFFRNECTRTVIYSVDTDIFVLSLYYATILNTKIWLQRPNSFISCHDVITQLSSTFDFDKRNLSNILLAVYCLSGNDTVSYPFKKGKKTLANILRKRLNML